MKWLMCSAALLLSVATAQANIIEFVYTGHVVHVFFVNPFPPIPGSRTAPTFGAPYVLTIDFDDANSTEFAPGSFRNTGLALATFAIEGYPTFAMNELGQFYYSPAGEFMGSASMRDDIGMTYMYTSGPNFLDLDGPFIFYQFRQCGSNCAVLSIETFSLNMDLQPVAVAVPGPAAGSLRPLLRVLGVLN